MKVKDNKTVQMLRYILKKGAGKPMKVEEVAAATKVARDNCSSFLSRCATVGLLEKSGDRYHRQYALISDKWPNLEAFHLAFIERDREFRNKAKQNGTFAPRHRRSKAELEAAARTAKKLENGQATGVMIAVAMGNGRTELLSVRDAEVIYQQLTEVFS